jgi:hypothetical protein
MSTYYVEATVTMGKQDTVHLFVPYLLHGFITGGSLLPFRNLTVGKPDGHKIGKITFVYIDYKRKTFCSGSEHDMDTSYKSE